MWEDHRTEGGILGFFLETPAEKGRLLMAVSAWSCSPNFDFWGKTKGDHGVGKKNIVCRKTGEVFHCSICELLGFGSAPFLGRFLI